MQREHDDTGAASGGAEGGYGTGSSSASFGAGSAPVNTGIGGTAPLADVPVGERAEAAGAGEPGDRPRSGRERAGLGADRGAELLDEAGSRARELKQSIESTLAERLETGASRLRERAASGDLAYAGDTGRTAGARIAARPEQAERIAEGMDRTARWLREGDLKSTISEQARTNPGRTLLVAAGVGWLLSRALRRR